MSPIDFTEHTYQQELDAQNARRRLIDQGQTVSFIAFDPRRNRYVFDARPAADKASHASARDAALALASIRWHDAHREFKDPNCSRCNPAPAPNTPRQEGAREDNPVEWLRQDLAAANIKLREAIERAETTERHLAEQCGHAVALSTRQAFIDAYGEWAASVDCDSNDEEASRAAQVIEAAWQLLEDAKIVRPEDRP